VVVLFLFLFVAVFFSFFLDGILMMRVSCVVCGIKECAVILFNRAQKIDMMVCSYVQLSNLDVYINFSSPRFEINTCAIDRCAGMVIKCTFCAITRAVNNTHFLTFPYPRLEYSLFITTLKLVLYKVSFNRR